MKKVLVIAPYAYLPPSSGGQKLIAQFLHYLGKKTNLTVVSVAENDFTQLLNYQTIPLLKKPFSRYFDFSLIGKISTVIKEGDIDTVIWEHPYYAWLAFRVRKKTGARTFIHTHNIEYKRFRSTGRWWWPILQWYEKRAFRKADGLFFITPEDRQFAISKWKIDAKKCYDLPFGIESQDFPDDRQLCRAEIEKRHGIAPHEKIFLFTGVLSYKPNSDAVKVIQEQISPLLQASGIPYKILICGKGLPAELSKKETQHLIFTGFAENIALYYKAADIFLNPVLSGGGIKTKMVEAIAYGATVVSTATGATGIDKEVCGEKLEVVNDQDWSGFVQSIVRVSALPNTKTPLAYYQKYHWDNITESIARL